MSTLHSPTMVSQQPSSPSSSSNDSASAALPWILEHLLAYPGNYEIPLRTMYTLNSNPRVDPSSSSQTSQHQNYYKNAFPTRRDRQGSVTSTSSANTVTDTAARFKAHLMAQIAQLPSQPCSLPPTFITSFVRRCFPPTLEEVDFAQALTALDYLKDLENRRKKEVMAALERLGVTGAEGERDDLAKRYPGVLAWVTSIESKERTVIALYTQVYLQLRHWTCLNEMLLSPLNKANCIAMLNTLYPPIISQPPTAHLSVRSLMEKRRELYNYIRDAEEKGQKTLDPVIKKHMRKGDRTGWPVAQDYIEKYLLAANAIIDECYEINNRQSFAEVVVPDAGQRKGRKGKVDSGISFTSSDRPSTSSSTSSNSSKLSNKPLPPSPPSKQARSSGGSTLEKIAREIKKIKSRGDLSEAAKESKQRPKTLKKIKSSGILRDSMRRSSNDEDSAFDTDKFKQQRMEWEAKNAAKLEQAKRPAS